MYRALIFPVLKLLDAERAHRMALRGLRVARALPGGMLLLRGLPPARQKLPVRLFGLNFPNPLGVAAGLDKNAEAVAGLFALGFGHVEIGTVTPRPQPGNPKPRVWRLVEERAILNALGFPSEGADAVAARIVGRNWPGVLGVNLGKNKDTPPEKAAEDYVKAFRVLREGMDYAVVNVSSPNTPGLRNLQSRAALLEILQALREENARGVKGTKPVLVKLSPDLEPTALEEAVTAAVEGGAAGLVVSNTTLDRSSLREKFPDRPGGLSGAPLRPRAQALVGEVRKLTALPIIGVGGIATAADVKERLAAGASLCQMYTSFVYGGPRLAKSILKSL